MFCANCFRSLFACFVFQTVEIILSATTCGSGIDAGDDIVIVHILSIVDEYVVMTVLEGVVLIGIVDADKFVAGFLLPFVLNK